MLISELIATNCSHDLKSLKPSDSLLKMSDALNAYNIGILLVLDDRGNIAGVASERDLARAVATFRDDTINRSVSEIMTTRVITATPQDSVLTTLQIMTEANIRHMPVMINGKPKAMISLRQFEVAYKDLLTKSRTDHLTGLSNRRHFLEELEQELARSKRFGTALSIAMIDLDNFKRVNDTYGHDVGDDVIRAAAKILKDEFRNYDEIGRLGGEEFAVVLPNTDLASAKMACERVIKSIRAHRVPTEHDGEIKFTASFGIYQSHDASESPRRVLKYADTLLYRAKQAGRDCIFADDRMLAQTPDDARSIYNDGSELTERALKTA